MSTIDLLELMMNDECTFRFDIADSTEYHN